jgi:hypothetical protein
MRIIWAASLLFAGCTADAQVAGPTVSAGYVEPAPTVVVAQPPLVEVEPGVQVVDADYDQPVFYSDSMYWRYDGGIWYSSRYHDRGWYRNDRVPERVHHIDRPERYSHYHSTVRVEGRHEGVRVEGRHEEGVRVEGRHEEGVRHEEPRHEEGVRVEGRHEEGVRHEEPRHEEPRHEEGHHEEAIRHDEAPHPTHVAPAPAKPAPAKPAPAKHDEKKKK